MSKIISLLNNPITACVLIGLFCFAAGYSAAELRQRAHQATVLVQQRDESYEAGLRWARLQRRGDSTYARLLGRADEQRLQQDLLRQHDDAHKAHRPVSVPFQLPAFPIPNQPRPSSAGPATH